MGFRWPVGGLVFRSWNRELVELTLVASRYDFDVREGSAVSESGEVGLELDPTTQLEVRLSFEVDTTIWAGVFPSPTALL